MVDEIMKGEMIKDDTAASTRPRPITFSPRMIEGIRNEQKTQTRRVVSPLPLRTDVAWPTIGSPFLFKEVLADTPRFLEEGFCPYGKPGGLLWVREVWRTLAVFDKYNPTSLVTEIGPDKFPIGFMEEEFLNWPGQAMPGRWRSPRHMPKALSRFLLEVKAIRLEKLQDISRQDAVEEGVEWSPGTWTDAIVGFSHLWDAINTRHTWKDNPWVWVVEFSLVSQEEDRIEQST